MYKRAAVAVLVLATGAVHLGSASRAQASSAGEILSLVDCRLGYKWAFKSPRVLHRTEPVQRNENRTSRSQTTVFMSTSSRTVQKHISAGIESELGGGFAFVQASIRAKFGIEVVRSKTASVNNSQTAVVGPRRVAIGAYGVYTRTFAGYFVRRARPGEGGFRNRRCPRLRAVGVVATVPLDEVGWVIRTARLG